MSDLFKAIGIEPGEHSLIKQTINPIKIMKGAANVSNISRAGTKRSARENLYANWNVREVDIEKAYGDENLKNTHGEMYHTDNDKQVEKEVTTAMEAGVQSDGQENLPANQAATSLTLSECLDDLIKADDSSYTEDEPEDVQQQEIDREIKNEKNKKIETMGTNLKMSELDEIYDLVKSKTDMPKPVKKEQIESSSKSLNLDGMSDADLAKIIRDGVHENSSKSELMDISDEEMARRIKRGVHENSKGISRKSELDSLVDLVKDYKQEPVVKGTLSSRIRTGTINKNVNPFVKAFKGIFLEDHVICYLKY